MRGFLWVLGWALLLVGLFTPFWYVSAALIFLWFVVDQFMKWRVRRNIRANQWRRPDHEVRW